MSFQACTDINVTSLSWLNFQLIQLGLAIHRRRLVGFTVAMLALIISITVWFHRGMALTHFESRDKDSAAQIKLLDEYNAHAGHIATLFGTPIELFVTVAVQLIVLRAMAERFARPEMSWKISVVTLAIDAGVGYMISNCFNALNVQLRPQQIRAIVSQADLGLDTIYDKSYFQNRSALFEYKRIDSEMLPKNPVTNTLLRTLLVPTEPRRDSGCARVDSNAASVEAVEESFLHHGFPQRDWQGRILQEAQASETLRMDVNASSATDASPNSSVAPLPMNASLAADLFLYAMLIGPTLFPWGDKYDFVNQTDLASRYPSANNEESNYSRSVSDTATKLFGLLPTDPLDEAAQKAWFLKESAAALTRQFASSTRTRRSDIVMEFSHTQITLTINVDAVTLDVQLDPMLLATTATEDQRTRYTVLDQFDDCTWPEHCMIRKADYKVVEPMYDPPAQVIAFKLCTDVNGKETLLGNVTISSSNNSVTFLDAECFSNKTASLLVASISKRLEAEALEQNVSRSANGTVIVDSLVTVTNLRKIYSFTVGRLSWEYTNLAKKYNAECSLESGCLGLELELDDHVSARASTINRTAQQLVVGKDKLPKYTLNTISEELEFGSTDLLVLNEPPDTIAPSPLYRIIAGDVLLPHNIANVQWDPRLDINQNCSARIASRVVSTVDNHFYMERTLQTTYTTAIFFLLQNAVVRYSITLSGTRQSLAFSGNTQHIAVWASTQAQNMWLTLAGCMVLTVGLLSVLIKAMCFAPADHDAFASISDPHAIARVVLNERQYPPLFLHRQVVERDGVGSADNFAIAALSLQQQEQQKQQQQQLAGKNTSNAHKQASEMV